jgi:carboxypeptidase family protein
MRRARFATISLALAFCGFLGSAGTAAAGSIEGKVTETATGEGVGGIFVCAHAPLYVYPGGCGFTDGDGRYTIAGLVAGPYMVRFEAPGFVNLIAEYFDGKQFEEEAGLVSFSSGLATGIDAALETGGEIAGTVTDATTHQPIEGIEACARNLDTRMTRLCDRSNSEGHYLINRLATGSYKVQFSVEGSPNYMRQFYPGKSTAAEAANVAVTAGVLTAGIDDALHEGVQITGRITAAGSGEPLAWIVACALDPLTEAVVGCGESDPLDDHRYSIAGLPLGSYVVGVSISEQELGTEINPDGYVRQYYRDRPSFGEADLVGGAAGLYPGVDAHLTRGQEVFPTKPLPPVHRLSEPHVWPRPLVPKPLDCKKHFRKKKVKGKVRCVKKQPKHRRHAGRAGAH